jgi:hypothetical protein
MKVRTKQILAGMLLAFSITPLIAWRVDSAPVPPPSASPVTQVYSANGRGTMTVDGAGCCDGVVFPGTFELDYEVDNTSGQVNITRLSTGLADMDVAFHFLIFETARVHIRCGSARNMTDIVGSVDGSGNLTIPSGAATLDGTSYQQRDEFGKCGGEVSGLTLTNNAALVGSLDPASNRVSFAGVFSATTEGNSYNIRLDMTGDYINRPPVAVFGVEGPGLEAFPQGGCPAVMNGGNPPEPTVEANDADGLKMYLRSFSSDPDGAWPGADLRLDQWFHGRDSGPIKFIGESRRLGPVLFEFGPVHHVVLETTDRAGALASSGCDFRVVDTTSPTVTTPAPATIEATGADGTTPSTSDALRDFLNGSSAADAVDSAPTALPSLMNGKEVKDNTLFPIGDWLTVYFRYVDNSGNVGIAVSSVRVVTPKK